MAHTSFGDIVLVIVVLTTSVTSGSSLSKHISPRKKVEALKLSALLPDIMPTPGTMSEDGSSSDVRWAKRRDKRCTCYTYKDKECVYYCHLDIIWINTPERSVPYGMSSYPKSLRRRRSAEWLRRGGGDMRCVCSLQTDYHCASFCTDKLRTSLQQLLEQTRGWQPYVG